MKYLGILVSNIRLMKEEMSGPIPKVEGRLGTWKRDHLYYAGKVILINTSLTSIPMYMMGVYWLHEGTY